MNSQNKIFKMWSLYPFISRDISVWVKNEEDARELEKIIKENATDLLIKEPKVVDSFIAKDGRVSVAFRLVFQSFDRTLNDTEVNEIVSKITNKINAREGWQVR